MNFFLLKKLATKYRIECLTSIYQSGTGYTGESMSVMDILVALYYGFLREQPIFDIQKDYMVLPKIKANAFEMILKNTGQMRIGGHVFADFGQGLSVAVGMALALKMDAKDSKVFVLMNDSELQKGNVFEAAMAAGHYKLNNLILIVEKSGLQNDGFIKSVMDVEPIHGKFMAFNWRVFHAADGHSFEELIEAMDKVFYGALYKEKPAIIIANTIKGKGVPFAENNSSYQNTALSEQEISHVIPMLQEQLEFLDSKAKGVL